MRGQTAIAATTDNVDLGENRAVTRSFARHETFHPRYGWLKKGFDAVVEDPEVFLAADAPIRLGVGKNMVRAIRYWSRAFKIVEEYSSPDRPRTQNARATAFGTRLLGSDGWDPYLEHPGSLWLLHWRLLSPVSEAPTWYFVFNLYPSSEFTEAGVVEALGSFRDTQTGWERIVDQSLKKDVNCLLRMYTGGARLVRDPDDGIDSPFTELTLIRPTAGDSRHYTFTMGPKPSLPDGIVAHACADFIVDNAQLAARSIALRRLVIDEGSPGRVFKLSENDLRAALERFDPSSRLFRVTDPAGVQQLTLVAEAATILEDALDSVFMVERKGVAP